VKEWLLIPKAMDVMVVVSIEEKERCLMLCVQTVGNRVRYHSSPLKDVQFTAKNVTVSEEHVAIK